MNPTPTHPTEPHKPKGGRGRDGRVESTEDRLRSLRDALRAARLGDFSVRLPADGEGLTGEVALAFNALVGQNEALTTELDRIERAVGQEGRTRERASLGPVSGGWARVVDSVNCVLKNMAWPVAEATSILRLVADGDLSRDMPLHMDGTPLTGDFAELASSVRAMMSRLRAVSSGVSGVVREIGAEGKLGTKASVEGLTGTWRGLVDDVNLLAGNLTDQVRNIAVVSTAIAKGDLSQKITVDTKGEILELKNAINATVDQLRSFAAEVIRVAREVGTDGQLGAQADVRGVSGVWQELTDSVNWLASNLTSQVRNIAQIATAIAGGDLSQKITVEAKGEILELKNTINAMVDQLRTFAGEVTRVAREVGTEGKLGALADVRGVSGTWKDLTDSVNLMAMNLTEQVRGIARVVTAVAGGDLTQKLVVEAKGEIAALADTINNMTETLRTFADQVTTVAREVGIEGRLGGQAKVPGAAGTWRDLTDNVNQLAQNLTSQVRAISEVATAVIQGNLSRQITVVARGEVQGLKDTINQMIANLRDTTRSNTEQDWLKTNLARFFGIMQGQRDLQSLTDQIISELTPVVGAQVGALYLAERHDDQTTLKLSSTYAYVKRKHLSSRFALGEGLVGQCARERKPIIVTEVPDDYVHVASGLGDAAPRSIVAFPVIFEGQVRGVIELGSFHEFTAVQLSFLEQLMLSIGLAINLIGTSMRTEQLLEQLQGSNVELERRRGELEDRARLLEVRNREIAQASTSLEAKSQELARVSQYKSQFLTNMSHEIRTPLNSMMILAQMLAADEDQNLTDKQREWAATIHSGGRDLLALINQILDLSKVEAGRVDTNVTACPIEHVREFAERTFRPVALQQGIELAIEVEPGVPSTFAVDRQLLDQILRNLLSNAFRFTERGRVELRIGVSPRSVAYARESLRLAPAVLAFSVSDTGIGIPPEHRDKIFEAFQQADATITRKFGGTGLGLTISREYARLLGGEIALQSTSGVGSTFTLYVPLTLAEPAETPITPLIAAGPPAKEPPSPTNGPLSAEEADALAGRKILVVEDDARNLYAVTSLLERLHATVIPATGAIEAYAALRDHPDVDLVLMDIMMPDIDGYQATRHIRTMGEVATVPVVALTAKASAADRDECMAAGFDDYLVKPADVRHLVSTMVRHFRR